MFTYTLQRELSGYSLYRCCLSSISKISSVFVSCEQESRRVIYRAGTIVSFVGRMCIVDMSHGLRIRDVIRRRTRSISTTDRTCGWRRRFLWSPVFICLSAPQVQYTWNGWWIVRESLTIGQRHFPGFWEHQCGHIDSVLIPLLFRTSICAANLV